MTVGFWDVDTQRDFMEPEGAMYVKGVEKIVPNINKLHDAARDKNVPLVASACHHTAEDEEFKEYPPHCLIGTKGAERIADAGEARVPFDSSDIPNVGASLREQMHVVIEKKALNVFSNPNTSKVIEDSGVNHWFVFGVCTDLCVKDAVIGLLERKQKVTVVVDAILGQDPEASLAWIGKMREQGAQFQTTDDLIQNLGK